MSRISCLALAFGLAPIAVWAQGTAATPSTTQPQPPLQFNEAIEVVGVTPIHGLGLDRNLVPGNIQTAGVADVRALPGSHLGDVLTTGFASIVANETQSNPYQPDIQFRGFAASPLLGLPQGIAVYQDGVRVNEPFGDTVNWDLLPTNAIASVNVMPGSNPLFGLNALGGAISIQTKTGFTSAGHGASAFAGSFGRRWADVQSAGHTDRVGYFVTARLLSEDGWRDFSSSRVRQVFGNIEWRGQSTTLNVTVTAAGNRLIGNGPAPVQLLEGDRAAVFTHPDITNTGMSLFSLTGRRVAGARIVVDGLLYVRPAAVKTFNGDSADLGPFNAANNTSTTRTRGWGGSVQATAIGPPGARPSHFIAGASLDGAGSRYRADTELARLTATRGTQGSGLFDHAAAVRLRTTTRHAGVYAAEFLTVLPAVTLMGSARLTHSIVNLRDQLGSGLTGDHRFTRLNPATGVTVDLPGGLSTYGSLSVSSRVPTPSELSCADPADPCRLPNAFLSDPPLKQVVAQTWEAGLRRRTRRLDWTAAVFRTTNRDDVVFISSGEFTNQGHFANVGDTLRHGIEVSLSGAITNAVRWEAAYTRMAAEFRTPLTLSSPNHPHAGGGEIAVAPGDVLPGVPTHNLKTGLTVTHARLSVGATVQSVSSQFLRGDEANLLPPIDASTVVNVTTSYRLGTRTALTGRVVNLFNAKYSTFGLLGRADEVLGEDFDDPRFVSPGAPRAAWVGIEFTFP